MKTFKNWSYKCVNPFFYIPFISFPKSLIDNIQYFRKSISHSTTHKHTFKNITGVNQALIYQNTTIRNQTNYLKSLFAHAFDKDYCVANHGCPDGYMVAVDFRTGC